MVRWRPFLRWKGAGMSKYRNVLTWVCLDCGVPFAAKPERCGYCGDRIQKFDSKREAREYQNLKLLERAGVVSNIKLQPVFVILDKSVGIYRADFSFIEGGRRRVIDVKGFDTPLSKFKRKCVKFLHGVDVEVVR